MNYENKIEIGLLELRKLNFIKEFSVEDRTIHITFPHKPTPQFIKPSMDEIQVIDYLKISNPTTIEILMCIIEELKTTNTFPTQKKIANKIYKDNTTVCKSLSKLKGLNIVYKGEDGNYILSNLNNCMKEIIKRK